MANKMGKSPASLPIIAAVVVVFIAAIGFAMSTLGGGDTPAVVIPSIDDLTNSDVIGELEIPGEGAGSEATTPDANTSNPGSSAPTTSTPTTSTPGTSTPGASSSSSATTTPEITGI